MFVDYEQQSINNYNYNINYSGTNCTQYKPITLSLTIDQNGNQISTNSLIVSPEIANVGWWSIEQFYKVNNTNYCTYDQTVGLDLTDNIHNYLKLYFLNKKYNNSFHKIVALEISIPASIELVK
ncbi:MAG: hypothetical protein IIT97_03135, partial [Mycoplasmataceae bacterium]|nr:hypothetical protein [Mycoplasmataceae bacterium]